METQLAPMSIESASSNLVVQGIEPIARFCLRFRAQRTPAADFV
jgi:hypothetical protein